MKILMIGTPTCSVCKKLHPIVEDYCDSKLIEFEYESLDEIHKDLYDLLMENHVRQAPVFLLYSAISDKPRISTGENILSDLEIE